MPKILLYNVEHIVPVSDLRQCLRMRILQLLQVNKTMTAVESMLQVIKAVTKKQPSFMHRLVP